MSRPPDLGPDPRPLPNGLRPTWMPVWDSTFGGLHEGEIAVVTGDDLALCRGLVLDWTAGLVTSTRHDRAFWYRAVPRPWKPSAHEALLRAVGDEVHADSYEIGEEGPEPFGDVARRIMQLAAEKPLATIVIDTIHRLRRSRQGAGPLKTLARQHYSPMLVLAGSAPSRPLEDLREVASYVLEVMPLFVEVSGRQVTEKLTWPNNGRLWAP